MIGTGLGCNSVELSHCHGCLNRSLHDLLPGEKKYNIFKVSPLEMTIRLIMVSIIAKIRRTNRMVNILITYVLNSCWYHPPFHYDFPSDRLHGNLNRSSRRVRLLVWQSKNQLTFFDS